MLQATVGNRCVFTFLALIRLLDIKQKGPSLLNNGPSHNLREFLSMLGIADPVHLRQLQERSLSPRHH
jgi:hypothetical protein